MLLPGSPRPKMGLVLLSSSISDPKEATHTEICKLSNDTGPLLPPAKWKSLLGRAGGSPDTLCLYQHLAQQGSYLYGSFSPSVTFFSVGLPHPESSINACWVREWTKIYKIRKMEIQISWALWESNLAKCIRRYIYLLWSNNITGAMTYRTKFKMSIKLPMCICSPKHYKWKILEIIAQH